MNGPNSFGTREAAAYMANLVGLLCMARLLFFSYLDFNLLLICNFGSEKQPDDDVAEPWCIIRFKKNLIIANLTCLQLPSRRMKKILVLFHNNLT
jgi:hypothetical protein